MRIAGLVPHIEVCGGVRRYFEIGNAMVNLGHEYDLFYKALYKNKEPWVDYRGNLCPYNQLPGRHYDIVYTGAAECLSDLERVSADAKVVVVVARFYTSEYLKTWKKHGREYVWLGAGAYWWEQFPKDCMPYGHDCPGGVNISFFKPGTNNVHSPEKIRVLFYRRDEGDRRGLKVTLDGIQMFHAAHPGSLRNWEFIGYDTHPVPEKWNGLRQNNIIGVVTHYQEDLRDLLQTGDIIVSSQADGVWNNILIEGMACGLAAIGTKTASRDFLIQNETGRVMEVGNPASLARCLGWFLEDPKRITNCGLRALQRARQLSWMNYATNFLRIVRSERC